jgi:hypothetical protein
MAMHFAFQRVVLEQGVRAVWVATRLLEVVVVQPTVIYVVTYVATYVVTCVVTCAVTCALTRVVTCAVTCVVTVNVIVSLVLITFVIKIHFICCSPIDATELGEKSPVVQLVQYILEILTSGGARLGYSRKIPENVMRHVQRRVR